MIREKNFVRSTFSRPHRSKNFWPRLVQSRCLLTSNACTALRKQIANAIKQSIQSNVAPSLHPPQVFISHIVYSNKSRHAHNSLRSLFTLVTEPSNPFAS